MICKFSLYSSPPEKQYYPKAVGKAGGILSHTPPSELVLWLNLGARYGGGRSMTSQAPPDPPLAGSCRTGHSRRTKGHESLQTYSHSVLVEAMTCLRSL